MEAPEVLSALQVFNKYVISQARANLTRGKKNVSCKLYNSLGQEIKVNPRSFSNFLKMEEHGLYQDKGVQGASSSAKAPNSPYKFGSGTGKKGGLTNGIGNWVRAKRIQFKDRESGKFLSYEQTARLITRSVYHKGMKPSYFFTKPFEAAFKKLPDEIIEAYGLDLENFLKFTLKAK